MVLPLGILKFRTPMTIRGDALRSISRTTACNSSENVITLLMYVCSNVVKLVGIDTDTNEKYTCITQTDTR